MVEYIVEGKNIELDVNTQIEFTKSINDIRNPSTTNNAWTKQFDIPGTPNNNKQFGFLYEENIEVGYNPNLKKRCEIRVDSIPVLEGYQKITDVNDIDGKITYKIIVYGVNTTIWEDMGDFLLTDLDLSEYDHTYSLDLIEDTWESTVREGYYYPWVNYSDVPWTFEEIQASGDTYSFFPGFYIKTLIDKIFETYGYTYESDFFNSDEFKRLFIPYTNSISGGDTKYYSEEIAFTSSFSGGYTATYSANITYDPFSLNDSCCGTSDYPFVFKMPTAGRVKIVGEYELTSEDCSNAWIGIYSKKFDGTLTTELFRWYLDVTPGTSVGTTSGTFEYTTDDIPLDRYIFSVPYCQGGTNELDYSIDYSTDGSLLIGLSEVKISEILPTGLKQVDLFNTIFRMFNLYIEADKDDTKNLIIEPFNDFYALGTDRDWTYKVDVKDKKNKLMSEINSRSYRFTYKNDTDYLNQYYTDATEKTIGELTTYVNTTFFDKAETIELLCSPTAISRFSDTTNVVWPSIYKEQERTDETWKGEINTKWNWRILAQSYFLKKFEFNDGNRKTRFYTGTPYLSDAFFGYNFDSLLFDYPNSGYTLTYEPVDKSIGQSLYRKYWKEYMDLIKNQNSRLLKIPVDLSPQEISELSFADRIFIDDTYYYVNKLVHSPTNRRTQAELLLIPATQLIEVYIRNWEITDYDVWITEYINVSYTLHNDSIEEQNYNGQIKFYSLPDGHDGESVYHGSTSFSGTLSPNQTLTDSVNVEADWYGLCYIEMYLYDTYYNRIYINITDWADYISISNVSSTTPITGGTYADIDFRITNDSTDRVLISSNYDLRVKYYSDSGDTLYDTNVISEQVLMPGSFYDYNNENGTLDNWENGTKLIEIEILYPGYTGWIMIGSDTYTYYNPNYINTTPSGLDVNYSGSMGSITVSAYSTNNWTIYCDEDWVNIIDPCGSGTGNGSFMLEWDENPETATGRTAIIYSVSDCSSEDELYFELIQGAYPYGYISPLEQDIYWDGTHPETMIVYSNTEWELSADKSWIQLTGDTGFGEDTFTINADYYDSITGRTATLSIELSGGTIAQDKTNTAEIFQTPTVVTLTIDPSGTTYKTHKGYYEGQHVDITMDYPWGQWSATTSADWICQLTNTGQTGSGTTIIIISANCGFEDGVYTGRTAEIIFDGPNIYQPETLTIIQEASFGLNSNFNGQVLLFDSGKSCIDASGLTTVPIDIISSDPTCEWDFTGNVGAYYNFIIYYRGTTIEVTNGTTGNGNLLLDVIVNPTSTGGCTGLIVKPLTSDSCGIVYKDDVRLTFKYDPDNASGDTGYLSLDQNIYVMPWSGSTIDGYLSGTTYVDAPDGVYWIAAPYLINGGIISSSGGLATSPPMGGSPPFGSYCGTGSGWFQWYIEPNCKSDINEWKDGIDNHIIVNFPDTNTRPTQVGDQYQVLYILQTPPNSCLGREFTLSKFDTYIVYKDIGVNYTTDEIEIFTYPTNNWSLTTGNTWLSISGSTSGTGSSSFTYVAEENTGVSARIGEIYITSDFGNYTINVQQNYATLSLDYYEIDVTGVTSGTSQVTTQYSNYWTATPQDDWITISGGTGLGNGSFDWYVDDSITGITRLGKVFVSSDYPIDQELWIYQHLPPPPSPDYYWTFNNTLVDEISGLTITRTSGDTTYWNDGIKSGEQSLDFPGGSSLPMFGNSEINWTDVFVPITGISNAFSSSVWIYQYSSGATTCCHGYYINGLQGDQEACVNFIRVKTNTTSDRSFFTVWTDAGYDWLVIGYSSGVTSFDGWNHIVQTVEPSGTTGAIMKLYINNEYIDERYSPNYATSNMLNESFLMIGSHDNIPSFIVNQRVANLRFYKSKTLTQDEISAIYDEEKA